MRAPSTSAAVDLRMVVQLDGVPAKEETAAASYCVSITEAEKLKFKKNDKKKVFGEKQAKTKIKSGENKRHRTK